MVGFLGTREKPRRLNQLTQADYSLTAAQVHRLISAAACLRDRALIRAFAETGLRRAEAVSIAWTDVDLAACLLVVRNGKGGKMRMVPITPSLAVDLAALKCMSRSSMVFSSRQGPRLSRRQTNRIVACAGRAAGLTPPNPRRSQLTCHLLRHTFARRWKASGGDIEVLSHILGHASVKTTWDVYGRPGLTDIEIEYQKVVARAFHHFTPGEEG
ncbi:MAG: tyrosine-type recombinase/integrase [bacterium]|nr:tyrosine-type recombinase/integrase [bacterium]